MVESCRFAREERYEIALRGSQQWSRRECFLGTLPTNIATLVLQITSESPNKEVGRERLEKEEKEGKRKRERAHQ